jgi:8-amino-7-oxononanoate synthase
VPRPELLARLAANNQTRAAQSLKRTPVVVDLIDGRQVRVTGRAAVDFSSNDYLGLRSHPEVVRALAAARFAGSGASALVSGYCSSHRALEAALCQWLGRERAVLFSTGYMANLGVLETLLSDADLCVMDQRNHASLHAGAKASGATLKRYRHRNVDSAAQQLASVPTAAALLVTDSVFSMDGDLAPVAELTTLAHAHGASMLIDEAHALGVCGPRGAGLAHGVDALVIGTFGKALGSFGAFVAGPETLIEAIHNQCAAYRYTTALAPAQCEATQVAIGLAQTADTRRSILNAHIARFRRHAHSRGWDIGCSTTAIQPLKLSDSAQALALEARLLERGIWARAIRPPTVQRARLRLSFSAAHTNADLDLLLAALDDVC